jgi:hypothetical protein
MKMKRFTLLLTFLCIGMNTIVQRSQGQVIDLTILV